MGGLYSEGASYGGRAWASWGGGAVVDAGPAGNTEPPCS